MVAGELRRRTAVMFWAVSGGGRRKNEVVVGHERKRGKNVVENLTVVVFGM